MREMNQYELHIIEKGKTEDNENHKISKKPQKTNITQTMVSTRSKRNAEIEHTEEKHEKQKNAGSNDANKVSDDEVESDTGGPDNKRQKTDNATKVDSIGGLTMEHAKSGRSTCRKCDETIAKDAPRVGMEAWISGRKATTWQCVNCALSNISVGYEKTGRSKDSIAGSTIDKGVVKFDVHSHTASRHFTMDTIQDVLVAVLAWVPSSKKSDLIDLLSLDAMDGNEDLKKEDREKVESMLSKLEAPSVSERGSIADKEDQAKDDDMKTSSSDGSPDASALKSDGKPKVGQVAHQEGEVEWKFAGGKYKGNLLPNKETEEKCFAETHTGNVKTLNKDKKNWKVID